MTSRPLAPAVLDWLLRRVRPGPLGDLDLVLVQDNAVLADLPPAADLVGESWRLQKVQGEVTLRDALPDADRLVAVVPAGTAWPPDLLGRALLGKVLTVRAEDVVAAVTGRFCETILDEALAGAVFTAVDVLRERFPAWSFGSVVSQRDVRALLVAAELGADQRLDRERDDALLARWIVEGPPTFRVPVLVEEALREAHPRTGPWLAWAAMGGGLADLVAVGALAGSPAGQAVSPALPPRASRGGDRQEVRSLVERAVRSAWERSPARTREVLARAEEAVHRANLPVADAARHPLLKGVLERALHALVAAAARGDPPQDTEIEGLEANLHASGFRDAILLARDVSRLARARTAVATPAAAAPAAEWLTLALRQVSWVDLALRSAGRRMASAPSDLARPAAEVIAATLAWRDALNASFGHALARDWPVLSASKDLRRPLPLHHVGRSVLRRLLADGHRVLLYVLDGCDLSSFLEMMLDAEGRRGIGLALPSVQDPALREDLARVGPLHVAVSPVPTVTGHSRRALFAGEIPGNTALDDTESPAANASRDAEAWARNAALADVPNGLFLKGDLAGGLEPFLATLEDPEIQCLAVVWNAVDDALSSRETTPIPSWTFPGLGLGAFEVLRRAADLGWTIVVTADHGHTPYVAPDRKVLPSALGSRFHDSPCAGSVAFATGPLPRTPLHLLTAVGAWHGTQRRGFHGGASLEEVAVPLAFLGRVAENAGRPVPPPWWWGSETVLAEPTDAVVPAPPPPPVVPPPSPGASSIPADVRALLTDRPAALRVLEVLAERQVLTLAQAASIGGSPALFTRGLLGAVLADIARAGLPPLFDAEGEGAEQTFRWILRR